MYMYNHVRRESPGTAMSAMSPHQRPRIPLQGSLWSSVDPPWSLYWAGLSFQQISVISKLVSGIPFWHKNPWTAPALGRSSTACGR